MLRTKAWWEIDPRETGRGEIEAASEHSQHFGGSSLKGTREIKWQLEANVRSRKVFRFLIFKLIFFLEILVQSKIRQE